MKKRVLAVLLSASMVAGMFAGCGKSEEETVATTETTEETTESEELSEEEAWKLEPAYGETIIITGGAANCVSAVFVADELGFIEEEGLKVERERIGSTEAMNAVAAGKADFVTSHISQMTVPIINGLGLKMIGAAMTGCQSLYVLADSEYQTTEDLIGKNVNIVSGVGSQDHNIVLRFMAHDGIPADAYNFKTTEMGAVIQGLQSGELDATLLSDMFASKFVEQGVIRQIRSLTWDEDFMEEPCCVFAVNPDFLEQNPITVKKLLRATAKASAWIDSHIAESVELMAEMGIMSREGDADTKRLNELQDSYDWTVTQEKTEETLKLIIEEYKELGLIDTEKDSAELLDLIWDGELLTDEELAEVWEAGIAYEAN